MINKAPSHNSHSGDKNTNELKLLEEIKPLSYKDYYAKRFKGHLMNRSIDKLLMLNDNILISLDNFGNLINFNFVKFGLFKGLEIKVLFKNENELLKFDLNYVKFNKNSILISLLNNFKLILINLVPKTFIIFKKLNTEKAENFSSSLKCIHNEEEDINLIWNWNGKLFNLKINFNEYHNKFNFNLDDFKTVNLNQNSILNIHQLNFNKILLKTSNNFLLNYDLKDSKVNEKQLIMNDNQNFKFKSNKCFYLNDNSLYCGILLSWSDKLILYLKANDYLSALSLTLINFKLNPSSNFDILNNVLRQSFISAANNSTNLRSDATISKNLLSFSNVALEAAHLLDNLDFIYSDLFDFYVSLGKDFQYKFLFDLEPYISSNKLHSIPPNISNLLLKLIDPSVNANKFQSLILLFDPTQLDLNYVIKTCKTYNLWTAFAYIHINALNDFITPLLEFFKLIKLSNDNNENYEPIIIFDYIYSLLCGLNFPNNSQILDYDSSFKAKSQIYLFLFGSNLHHDDISHSDFNKSYAYPYIRLLLKFKPQLFFDVLNFAFEDSYLNDESNERVISRQTIINILLEIEYTQDFNQSIITYINIFVSKNLPKYPQFLLLPSSTILRLLISLSNDSNLETIDDRELSVQSLLSTFTPNALNKIIDQFLDLFEKASFFKILKSCFKSKKKFDSFLSVILKDLNFNFKVIDQDMTFNEISYAFKNHVNKNELIEIIKNESLINLLNLNSFRFISLIQNYFADSNGVHLDLVHSLNVKYFQLVYLKPLIEDNYYLSGLSDDLKLKYITLIADIEPQNLKIQLEKYKDNNVFDLDKAEEISRTFNVVDSTIWILNYKGEHTKVFNEMSESIKRLSENIIDEINDKEISELVSLNTLKRSINIGINVCIEHSHRNTANVDQYWFNVLKYTINSIKILNDSINNNNIEKIELIINQVRNLIDKLMYSLLLNTKSTQINFSTFFQNLVKNSLNYNSNYQNAYNEFRFVLEKFIVAYQSEREVYSLVNRIIDVDTYRLLDEFHTKRKKGHINI